MPTVSAQIDDLIARFAPSIPARIWVKNAAEESKVIDEMRKGSTLVIKAATKRGRATTDTYSLSGFSQAVEKVLKDCPG